MYGYLRSSHHHSVTQTFRHRYRITFCWFFLKSDTFLKSRPNHWHVDIFIITWKQWNVAGFVLHCRCVGESPPPSDGQQIHILKLFFGGGGSGITHGGQSKGTQQPQTTKANCDTWRSVCLSPGRFLTKHAAVTNHITCQLWARNIRGLSQK